MDQAKIQSARLENSLLIFRKSQKRLRLFCQDGKNIDDDHLGLWPQLLASGAERSVDKRRAQESSSLLSGLVQYRKDSEWRMYREAERRFD